MKIVAVMDPDTALGFRLAGLEVREAVSVSKAVSEILALLTRENVEDREVGLVLYTEEYLELFSEELRIRLERSDIPIFTPVPSMKTWKKKERAREYVTGLLKRTMGYQIRLR